MLTREENIIKNNAIDMCHKGATEQEWQKYICNACNSNMYIATDIIKEVYFFLDYLDKE